jgi:HEAT repeat protein
VKYFRRSNRSSVSIWLTIHLCCFAQFSIAAIQPDFLMDSDPEFQLPAPIEDFNPEMAALWIKALNRPEIDMQRMAAETIARAHKHGIPDLNKAIPRLEEILLADSSHPAARYAAAHALVVLESRNSSAKLFEASQVFGSDLRQLIEPTLADWNVGAAKARWIERLGAPEVRPRDVILAIRGLGQFHEQSVLPELLSMASDVARTPAIRLEAATAAGKIAEQGLEQDAERLSRTGRTPPYISQFCAIKLLSSHTSDAARQLLLDLASHTEPAIVGAALQRLNEIDSALVLPLAPSATKSADPGVRNQGVTAMLRFPSVGQIMPLSQLLNDPHPGLRRKVCEGLFGFSEKPELDESVRDAVLQALGGDHWEGQEQAALLLGALKHQPAADRLVELLESPRAEVNIAAAWALRKVAVQETIPALIDRATRQTEYRRNVASSHELDNHVAHLFEAIAVLRAEDAMPLLKLYIPKRVSRNNLSRGAAIWAIGRLNKGIRHSEIEADLVNRLRDIAPQPWEISRVKQMSAISLARMGAVEQATMMRQYATSVESTPHDIAEGHDAEMRLELALGWALNELTGEELPPPRPSTVSQGRWFLEPIR